MKQNEMKDRIQLERLLGRIEAWVHQTDDPVLKQRMRETLREFDDDEVQG